MAVLPSAQHYIRSSYLGRTAEFAGAGGAVAMGRTRTAHFDFGIDLAQSMIRSESSEAAHRIANIHFRQRSVQCADSFLRYLGPSDLQPLEILQFSEFIQPCVSDFRVK
jgi:hypothetical protein